MAAERGEFLFDTNIEQVRQRIVGELGSIGRAVDGAEGRIGRSAGSSSFLESYQRSLATEGARFLQGVQNLGRRTREALAQGTRPPNVTKELQALGAQYKREIEGIQRSLKTVPRELAGSSIFSQLTATATREAGAAGRAAAVALHREFSNSTAKFSLPTSTFKSLEDFGTSKGLLKTLSTSLPEGARASTIALERLLDQIGRTKNGFRSLDEKQAASLRIGATGKGALGGAGLSPAGQSGERVRFTDPTSGDMLELRGRNIANVTRELQAQRDADHGTALALEKERLAAQKLAEIRQKQATEAFATLGRRNIATQLTRDAADPNASTSRVGRTRTFVSPQGAFTVDSKGEAQKLDGLREADAIQKVARARMADMEAALRAADSEERLRVARVGSARLANEVANREAKMVGTSRVVRADGSVFKSGLAGVTPVVDPLQQFLAQRSASHQTQGQGLASNFAKGFFSPGFGGGGNGPRGLEALALSAGTTAKYAALSTVLYGLTQVLRAGGAEILDYRDSLTDLNVAFGHGESASNAYIDSLAEVSRISGSNIGGALDSAARGVRAFASEQNKAGKEAAGFETARSANALALITGKDLKDTTGDVIAIGSAYHVASDGLFSIVDAVSAAKSLGGDLGNISQGLANAGVALTESGFSLQESADILSLVTAKTDQSGTLVGTRLSRISSIIQGGGARDLLSGIKDKSGNAAIDVNGTSRDQIVQLAAVYDQLSTAQQKTIKNRLGGTANFREFQVLLDGLKESGPLFKRFRDGVDSAGAGQDQLTRKSNDLVGTLRKIQGSISNIAVGLFRSGLFTPLVIGIKALEPALVMLEDLLKLYRQLTDIAAKAIPFAGGDELRGLIALGLEFLLVMKAVSGLKAIGGAASVVKGALGISAKGAEAAATNANTIAITRNSVAEQINTNLRRAGFITLEQEAAAKSFATAATNTETIAVERNTLAKIQGAIASNGGGIAGIRGAAGQGLAAGAARGSSLLGTVGGKVGAAGIALVLADVVWRKVSASVEQTTSSLEKQEKATRALGKASDEASAQESIKALRTAAVERGKVGGTFADRLVGGLVGGIPGAILGADNLRSRLPFAGNSGKEDERDLREAAKIEERRLKRIEAERKTASNRGTVDVFGDVTDPEALTKGLESLTASGKSATTQMNLLAKALGEGLGDKGGPGTVLPGQSNEIGTKIAGQFVGDIKSGLSKYVQDSKNKSKKTGDEVAATFIDHLNPETKDAAAVAKLRGKVVDTTNKFLDAAGVSDGGTLTQEQINTLAVRIANLYTGDGKQGEGGLAKTRANIAKRVARQIADATDPKKVIVDETTNALVQGIFVQNADQVGAEAQTRSGNDSVVGAQAKLAAIQRAVDFAGRAGFGATDVTQTALIDAQRALAEAQLERANAFASAEVDSRDSVGKARVDVDNAARDLDVLTQGGSGNTKEYADASKAYADAVVNLAKTKVEESNALRSANVAVGDAVGDAIASYQNAVALIATTLAGTGDRASAEKAAANARQAAIEAQVQRDNAINSSRIDPRDTLNAARQSIAALQYELANTPVAAEQKRAELQQQINEARLEFGRQQIAYTDAVRRANNFPGAEQQNAADDLLAARDNLSIQLRGTEEYFKALAAVRSAEVALARAKEANASVARQLAGDITNPLFTARNDLQAARDKLRNDRRLGAPQEVLNQDRLGVKQAEANVERTQFEQRLSDAQTNYELGRTSFQAYMRYLQSEHDRLNAIKHRTRQQQDELNEIDKLMKDAKGQMDAQFNFGDIKLPTPYEVRRSLGLDTIQAVQDAAGGMAGTGSAAFQVGGSTGVQSAQSSLAAAVNALAAAQTGQTVSISISGADKQQVLAILTQYLGPEATGRAGSTYRKA